MKGPVVHGTSGNLMVDPQIGTRSSDGRQPRIRHSIAVRKVEAGEGGTSRADGRQPHVRH